MEEPPWRIIAPVGRRSGVAVLRAVLAGLLLVFLAILGLVVAGEGRHVGEGSVLLGRLSTGAALGKRSESQWSDLLTDESIYRRLMGSVALSLQRKRANGAAELQRLAMIQGTSRGRLDTEVYAFDSPCHIFLPSGMLSLMPLMLS